MHVPGAETHVSIHSQRSLKLIQSVDLYTLLMTLAPSGEIDVPTAHSNVLHHLSNVCCADRSSELVVKRYAACASVWHKVVETATKEVLPGCTRVRLQTLLNCIQVCAANDTPPPPFLVYFQNQFMHDWASNVVDRLISSGGRRWSMSERAHLASNLKNMTSKGLCHRRHVNIVDCGRNPYWLCEYVKCILCVWKEYRGVPSPVSIQYFKKLATCTTECISLISDYSCICMDTDNVERISASLYRMQQIVFSSFSSTGISNAAASSCIIYIKFGDEDLDLLEKVESILSFTWDLIITPQFEDASCTCLPGIQGSHVEEFCIPSLVVAKGSVTTIMNCICSSLMLSYINPGDCHCVTASASYPSLKALPNGIMECLCYMLSVDKFGGTNGCTQKWWDEYILLTSNVVNSACARLEVDKSMIEPPKPTSVTENVDATAVVTGLRVRRLLFKDTKVNKVFVAGNLFDRTAEVALRSSRAVKVYIQTICDVKDPRNGGLKKGSSIGGKVFSDMLRVTKELDIANGVTVDTRSKCICYHTPNFALRMLYVILEYMTEMSKSRRKRGDSFMSKKNNKKPEHDGRRKPRRPSTQPSTVCDDA